MNERTNFLRTTIEDLEQKSLKRAIRTIEGPQDARVILDGDEVLNFCSNNYLGLANDPRLKQAAIDSIEQYGCGSGASRLVCGSLEAHQALEEKIAQFKGTESCLLFGNGYMANVGIISSLFKADDIIFCDKLNHASIIDGIMLSQVAYKRYAHGDMDDLKKKLKSANGSKKRVIITDSVFSMDGDIAPLDQIVTLASRYGCMVMIDEAHALGVMGQGGRGLAEHFGVEDKIDIQMGTLSKAAGSYGAYVCGRKELIEFLINKARSFVYTTALPPAVASASLKAIEIIEQDQSLREHLWTNTRYMHERLKQMGFNIMNSQTPIVPILVGDSAKALEFSRLLLEEGVWMSAIRPPTVPAHTARLRLTIMATHARQELDFCLEVLQKVGKSLCLI